MKNDVSRHDIQQSSSTKNNNNSQNYNIYNNYKTILTLNLTNDNIFILLISLLNNLNT